MRLQRHVFATIRQATGKQYPALESLIEKMDDRELQDMICLVRDVEFETKKRVRARGGGWLP